MKTLIRRPQNGPISEPVERLLSDKYLLSEDNGFRDEAFSNEWEIVREPGVDPAFERANPGDFFA